MAEEGSIAEAGGFSSGARGELSRGVAGPRVESEATQSSARSAGCRQDGASAGPLQIQARAGRDLIAQVDGRVSIRLDAEGRWCSLRDAQGFYRRLMDGGAVAQSGSMPVDVPDTSALHGRARSIAAELLRLVESGRSELALSGTGAGKTVFLELLGRATEWSDARYDAQRESFARVYPEPLLVLPPDRYLDLIVLPSSGCPNGACSFCAFYRNRPFRILSSEEYRSHLAKVQGLFGRALGQRNGVFLGSANALAVPQARLLEAMDETRELTGPLRRGVAAFFDPDHAPSRSTRAWSALRRAGLTRVYAGLETGVPWLRRELGKSERLERFTGELRKARAAGVRVGVIVLVGPGGSKETLPHRRMTADAISRMGLGPQDLVYLSPLRGSMPAEQLRTQQDLLRRQIREHTAARVSSYGMDGFRYYS